VIETGYDERGNYAYLYSREADETYGYFHMQEAPEVKQGDSVKAGERIGVVGCTGSCSGDHLHFEVHEGRDAYEHAIDPLPLLRKLD
jgi:murein DD-endopeptidase MepM/ murein hydrolase activator NlpD